MRSNHLHKFINYNENQMIMNAKSRHYNFGIVLKKLRSCKLFLNMINGINNWSLQAIKKSFKLVLKIKLTLYITKT